VDGTPFLPSRDAFFSNDAEAGELFGRARRSQGTTVPHDRARPWPAHPQRTAAGERLCDDRKACAATGIATKLGNHSFRTTGITAYLKNGGTQGKAAAMANHASTRTTQLYDRQRDELSLDEVERIVINLISVSTTSRSGSSERRTPGPPGI
jgi:integrase